MPKADPDGQWKRQKIQTHFYNIVGTIEHINIPKLEHAIQKEFNTTDKRQIDLQVRLMQTEGRIRVQENAKVRIRQPLI